MTEQRGNSQGAWPIGAAAVRQDAAGAFVVTVEARGSAAGVFAGLTGVKGGAPGFVFSGSYVADTYVDPAYVE